MDLAQKSKFVESDCILISDAVSNLLLYSRSGQTPTSLVEPEMIDRSATTAGAGYLGSFGYAS